MVRYIFTKGNQHMSKETIVSQAKALFESLGSLEQESLIEAINEIRLSLREHSPFKEEPVDCVQWVKNTLVHANDYNPNSVASPEMKLLEHSITTDGYTQPIVTWPKDGFEVVDGFHRHRVGKESDTVNKRVLGYLPVVVIKPSQEDKNDRMASTIRHNRARGEHKIETMAEIVIELKRRFWDDKKIAIELGMEPDEVLRLTQVTGLAAMFAGEDFSTAWEATNLDDVDTSELGGTDENDQ